MATLGIKAQPQTNKENNAASSFPVYTRVTWKAEQRHVRCAPRLTSKKQKEKTQKEERLSYFYGC
jgi:hypothetical protein